MTRGSDPLFTVKLEKGLADRRRLPLSHVISVLDELRQLIAEIGRELERRRGLTHATGNFGLELVAGEKGLAFDGGSVQASIAVTERPGTGFKAIQSVIETVGLLDNEDFPEMSVDKQIDRHVVRRLSRIAAIQKRDRTQMRLTITRPGQPKPLSAIFGSNGIAAVRSLQAPTFRVDGSVLYGKLFELIDRTLVEDEEEDKGFWGELKADDGETWRVQFRAEDAEKAAHLFRKQVKVNGTAVYYRIAHPKLICERIDIDMERDLETAFDELYGSDKELYKTDLRTLLKQLHGED